MDEKKGSFRYKRFLLAFVAILVAFLFIIISFLVSHYHEMTDEVREDGERELMLIGTFAREALIKRDYAEVERFLLYWAREHHEILSLKAVAPNNFVLVDFTRTAPSKSSLHLEEHIVFEGRDLIHLEMIRDLSPTQQSMVRSSLPVILGSIVLFIMIGIILWYTMRKLALVPMEHEISIRQQAERRFRMLLESAPDAMVFVDSEGRMIMVNEQTEVLFGYKRDELTGKSIEMLMPEKFRERHRQMRKNFIVKPRSRPMGLEMELYGLARDGREFPVDISLSPVETDDGLFILSSIRDVSERKLSEEKIKRNYHFQSAISKILRIALEPIPLDVQLQHILDVILAIPRLSFESMGSVYLVDEERNVLVRKAQSGLPDVVLSACEEVPVGSCLCGKAAGRQKVIFSVCDQAQCRSHYDRKDMAPHSHYCVPVVSGEKTKGVINLVVREGHKRRKDEENLLISIANTLAVIIEHNRSEQEKQRLQAQLSQAEKLSALGRLTANVAHEIRNPLTLIGGFARRLSKNGPGNNKQKEYTDVITSEVDRLEKILKNILTYSRESQLNLEVCDINDILSDSLEKYEALFRKNAIDVSHERGTVPAVFIDKDQIVQVISNLVLNAVDSMPAGGRLTAATERTSYKGKTYTVLSLSDTGEGIPEDQLKMIFEPFYSTKLGKGTGLGLPICKKIMDDHGGVIRAESGPGKGSTFFLYFPERENNSH